MLRNSPVLPSSTWPGSASSTASPRGSSGSTASRRSWPSCLGLAFQSRPPERDPGRPGRRAPRSAPIERRRSQRLRSPRRLGARPAGSRPCSCRSDSGGRGARTGCETGKTPLVDRARRLDVRGPTATTRPGPRPSPPAQAIDDILQAGRGRKDPRRDPGRPRHRARLTLHRLPDPRPDRPEHHGGRALGDRLPAGELPDRQAAQVLRRHADAPARLPAGPPRARG